MSVIKGTNTIVAGYGGTKRSIGEVYFSQSSLATDNNGALPLFTGETIASANTIYPDFYNWVLSHTELQCTSAEYESALSTYGECPKYVVIASSQNNTPSVSEIISMSDDVMTLYYLRGTEISIDDPVFSSYEDAVNNKNSIGKVVNVYGSVDNTEEGFSVEYVNTDGSEPTFPTLNYEETLSVNSSAAIAEMPTDSVSIRLPLLKNYIKAANTSEGITQKEAGLPNITGTWAPAGLDTNNYEDPTGAFANSKRSSNGYLGHASKTGQTPFADFDASLSNPIYGSSDTVTPPSTTLYPWVVAYTAVIPASEAQVAGFQEVINDLNNSLTGKADKDLSNVNKTLLISYGDPDFTARIANSAGTEYTAASSGLLIGKLGAGGNYGSATLTLDGLDFPLQSNGETWGSYQFPFCVPVGAGCVYKLTASCAVSAFYFVPFKGGI